MMPRSIALLRAVNVGGKSIAPMAAVRALFEAMGFGAVRTLLQSGNVVFEQTAKAPAVESSLEAAMKKAFGRDIGVFVRDAPAWRKLVAGNPFAEEAEQDPSHLVVMCLKAAPEKKTLDALREAVTGRETFRAGEDCLYIYYPDGIGTSKFTGAVIERALGTTGTARNWNTVLKIASALA